MNKRCTLSGNAITRSRPALHRRVPRDCVGHLGDRVPFLDHLVDVDVRAIVDRKSHQAPAVGVVVIQVHHLVLIELIERHVGRCAVRPVAAAVAACGLARGTAAPGESEAAILGALIIEEDDARSAAARVAERLSLVDGSDRARPIGDHHSIVAIRLDHIDALDVDLIKLGVPRRARERCD